MKKLKTDKQVISIYNKHAREQGKLFGKETNPYFEISVDTLGLFSETQRLQWDAIKVEIHDKTIVQKVRDILHQDSRRLRPKASQAKAKKLTKKFHYKPLSLEERLDTDAPLWSVQRLHDLDYLRSHAQQHGFGITTLHLEWYREHELIEPLFTRGTEEWYASWQIHSLVDFERRKRETLDHPSGTPGQILEIWQDHILSYKKYIQENNERWHKLITLLLNARDLEQQMIRFAAEQYWAMNGKGSIRTKVMNDYLSSYAALIGKGYADKIAKQNKELTDGHITSWIHELVQRAFWLNPMLRQAHQFPSLIAIAQNRSYNFDMHIPSIKNGVQNPVKLASWYLRAADILAYYLECRTGEKVMQPEIIPTLSMYYHTVTISYCKICHKEFEKTPRRGGKSQVLCGSVECARENDRRQAIERRKRKKHKNK